jgi:protein-S-isoprenylcysteine O-methyltransferase Ste14
MKSQRVLPPTYLFVSIVVTVLLHVLLPITRFITWPWLLLGAVPLALGMFLNLAADTALKRHHTTVKPFEESSVLITTGVYHISRHPMYLGMVLLVLGIALLLGTLAPLLVVVVFAILLDRIFIRSEEDMLQEKFGDAWMTYCQRVRRWL